MTNAGVIVMEETSTKRPPEAVNMRGLFDLPEDGLVSSLTLTPDGCYVFAAFGGGEVRLYAQALRTVGAASRNGTIVAQIKSKVREDRGVCANARVGMWLCCCVSRVSVHPHGRGGESYAKERHSSKVVRTWRRGRARLLEAVLCSEFSTGDREVATGVPLVLFVGRSVPHLHAYRKRRQRDHCTLILTAWH